MLSTWVGTAWGYIVAVSRNRPASLHSEIGVIRYWVEADLASLGIQQRIAKSSMADWMW